MKIKMKFNLFLSLLGLAVANVLPRIPSQMSFDEFKEHFHRNYSTPEEEQAKKQIFTENLRFINNHNREAQEGQHSYMLKVNNFTDLTNQEYRSLMLGLVRIHRDSQFEQAGNPYPPYPQSRDWTKLGIISPVPDSIGNSWALAAAGAIESVNALAKGTLVELSVKQLIDCCRSDRTPNCTVDDALNYAMDGLDRKFGYPSQSTPGCHFNPATIGAKFYGIGFWERGGEDNMRDVIGTTQPIAASIDASQPTFQFYHSGVYQDSQCNTTVTNHDVLVVGYGPEKGTQNPFWKVKNWWGTEWGEEGFMRLARWKNMCGISNFPIHPSMGGPV